MMVSVTFLATTLAALVLPARGSMLVQRNISQTITGLKACDALIAAGLEDQLFFASDPGYNSSISSYWSTSVQDLSPWCILQPLTTQDVSTAVKTLANISLAGSWNIGVRGGGHSSWASNNVNRGVTFDLSQMNSINIHNSSSYVSVGPGQKWGPLYLEIEKYGLALVGGREGTVGVSGLTLGGGASFYTGLHGFACDGVVNFEVVLGDGSIVNANANSSTDLFKALKGGSNNFGIVTRFDLQTFAATPGGLYAGLLYMDYDTNKDAVLQQLVRLIDINEEHRNDAETVSFIYTNPEDTPSMAVQVVNVDGIENSTSFAPLNNLTLELDTRMRQSYGTFITTYEAAGGLRTSWYSLCFQNNINVMYKARSLFEDVVDDLNTLLPDSGYSMTFVFQPLPQYFANVSANAGAGQGNSLGLSDSVTANSVIFLAEAQAATVRDEAVINQKLAALTAELEAYAVAQGAATSWRYLNYVNPEQDPLSSYGTESVTFLKQVAKKYDPSGFFQKRVNGGFKLSSLDDY